MWEENNSSGFNLKFFFICVENKKRSLRDDLVIECFAA